MRIAKAVVAGLLALLAGACATAPNASFRAASEIDPDVVPTFNDPADVDAYVKAQDIERQAIRDKKEAEGYEDYIIVSARKAENVEITNVQEEGVDEGALVKATTDYLVILRRGRVYVVRHGDNTLKPVSSTNAFPPDDPHPDDTWYDELLLHQGMVIVIGYSYSENDDAATEISRFNLSEDGVLSYRDTHYLNSSDYYSSSNYASWLVGGKFYTYTPSIFNEEWRENLPFLERRNSDGSRERVGATLKPTSMGVAAAMMIDTSPHARFMHGITQCDVVAPKLTCETRTVLGQSGSEYYFSRSAAYIWTGTGHNKRWGRASRDWGSLVYRIPFDTAKGITAMTAKGDPVDQFSFLEDDETESLFVMTVGDFVFEEASFGAQMWESELAFGDAALLQIPLDAMGSGAAQLPPAFYRGLPEMEGRIQNRYVGRHLMIGGGYWDDDEEPPALYVTPLDAKWVQRIDITHNVSRIDRLGNDGVAIGEGKNDTLGFTAIEFSDTEKGDRGGARLGPSYILPSANEGENRSQAFFWRPDADNPASGDGIMALPVNKELEGTDFYYLGTSSAMFYLAREGGKLTPLGEIGAEPDETAFAEAKKMEALDEANKCEASCTDWYGNARPIFIGERMLALMGDEILEGELKDGVISEKRRINFAR